MGTYLIRRRIARIPHHLPHQTLIDVIPEGTALDTQMVLHRVLFQFYFKVLLCRPVVGEPVHRRRFNPFAFLITFARLLNSAVNMRE